MIRPHRGRGWRCIAFPFPLDPHRHALALAILTTLVASLPTRAEAAGTFYVDGANPACSDSSGAGGELAPYCTIGAALNANSGAGVTILVKPGVYREQVTPWSSGTTDAQLVLRALGAVVLDGSDDLSSPPLWTPAAGSAWLADSVSWPPKQVLVDGVRLVAAEVGPDSLPPGTFRYVPDAGLYVNLGGPSPGERTIQVGRRSFGFRLAGVSSVVIEGFTITRTDDRGIYVSGGCNDVTLVRNDVSFANRPGIQISNSTGSRVASNRCWENLDHGIALSAVTGSVVEDNECFANTKPASLAASGIYLAGSSRNVVRNNRAHHNEASGVYVQNGSNDNVSVQNRSWSNGHHGFDLFASTGTRHVGDLAWGNGREGFCARGGSVGTQMHDCIGAENAVATFGFQLLVETSSAPGWSGDDNVWWSPSGHSPIRFATIPYPTLSAFAAATGNETRSFQEDPRFVDAAGGDFHVRAGSRVIDSGNSSIPDWPELDAEGRARIDDPLAPDTGIGPVAWADRGPLEFVPPPGNQSPSGFIDSPEQDLVVTSGESVVLAGSGSDPDGNLPLTWYWDLGGGASPRTEEDPGLVSFAIPGVYTLSLTVTDARGLADPTPDTRTITVLEAPVAGDVDEIHWTFTGPTSVTVSWRGSSDLLRYGVSGAYGKVARGKPPVPYPVSTPGPFWEAKLSGLRPNTVYHYSIAGGPDHTFGTSPTSGLSDFVVMAEGDVGEAQTYARMAAVQSLVAAQSPDLCLMLGDLTYADDHGAWAANRHFNDVMVWSQDAAYMPVWGNHEWDTGDDLRNYTGRFDLPNARHSPGSPDTTGDGGDWYWFDHGNVRFIAYPEPWSGAWSHWRVRADSLMDLAQDDPAISYIVTFGHRPAYSSGHHPGSASLKAHLDALGAEHGKYVLNLNGHSHNYERSHPQNGVIHVTSGAGGATLSADPNAGCLWLGGCPAPPWSAFRALHHGALRLRFTQTGILGEMICGPAGNAQNPNDIVCGLGNAFDTFSIGAPNRAPVLVFNPVVTVEPEAPVTVPVTVSDPEGQPIASLAADLSGLPHGNDATFVVGAANAAGTFRWTPSVGDGPRTYFVTLRAENAERAEATLAIRVYGPDQAPRVGGPESVRVLAGETVVVPITALDPDGEDLEALVADLSGLPPDHDADFTLAEDRASGSFTWTPRPADGQRSYGVTFAAGNARFGSATVTITVDPVANQPPTARVTVLPSEGTAPLPVVLDASGSSDPEADSLSFFFDFGDGATLGPQNGTAALHTYQSGDWTASVIVTDAAGASDTTSALVRVGGNLVGNPSFETSTNGWKGYSGGVIAQITGGYEGVHALEVTGPTPAAQFGINDSPNWITTTAAIGARYRFSAWVRAADATGKVRLKVREYLAGLQVGASSHSPAVPLTPIWQPVSVDHVAAAPGSTLDFQVLDTPEVAGEVFEVDHIGIRLIPAATFAAMPEASMPERALTFSAVIAPNPLRVQGSGALRFSLSRPGPVRIGLYDLQGRLVRDVLDAAELPPGEYSAPFPTRGAGGEQLGPGVYFYRLAAAEGRILGRFVVLP